MSIPRKVTDEQVKDAMREAEGNYPLAARVLGVSEKTVRDRVKRKKDLNEIWGVSDDDPYKEALSTNSNAASIAGTFERGNRDKLNDAFRSAGIEEDTIKHLDAYRSFDDDMGSMLSASMMIGHNTILHSAVRLAEKERKLYDMLKNMDPDKNQKDFLAMHKLWLQTQDMLQKSAAKITDGVKSLTEIYVKLQDSDTGGNNKKKHNTKEVGKKPDQPLRP